MISALLSALATYNRLRFWLPLTAGIAWMGFVGWLVSGQSLAPVDYLRFNGLILIVYAIMLGYQLNVQFRSCRSQLVPHYGAAHVLAAFGVIVFVALLVTGTAAASWGGQPSVASQWQDVSPIELLVVAWPVALLCMWMGYRAESWTIIGVPLLFFVLVMVRDGARFQQWLSIIEGNRTQGTVLLVAMNFVLSVAFIRRVLRMNEEMPEYRVQYLLDSREPYKRMRIGPTERRTILQRLFGRVDERLDRIGQTLGQGLFPRLRHFQLGQPVQLSFLPFTGLMILLIWLFQAITGKQFVGVPSFWWFYGTSLVFSQWKRARLQWICMLPLRRRDIVIAYGGAMLFSVLRLWFSMNLAVFIAGWMSLPGTIRGIPAMEPFALSLAVQLLAFGIATLFGRRPRPARPFVLITAFFAGTLGTLVTVLVYIFLADHGKVSRAFTFLGGLRASVGDARLVIILTVTAALGVIWHSYRNWCQAEID